MKNLLKAYIDKRIEETLRRKERENLQEKWRIERLEIDRKREEMLQNRAKQYIEKLLIDGTCSVSTNGNDGYYGKNIPYDERESTRIKNKIRMSIMENVVKNLFIEDSGQSWSNCITFSLSEGLKADLQKLHNIKPKEK